jgi:choline dehydrogenase-like flavoprotein
MADDQRYDVVIIGTGAGGGTLGHRLATSGLRVLWLERGPFLPRERDNWETQAVFVRGKYLAPEVWYDGHGREFQPEVNYYVGGNTKFYGAALFRLRPEDFGELRHHGGISPSWPISYDELEPYYTQAEHLYLVHGEHGEDPSEGPASAQYAFPPVSHEPRIQQLSDDLEKLNLHPFHLPIGVDLQESEQESEPGRAARASACIRCDRVDGFPCLVDAKSDSQVICVDPVLSRDNVTLVTGAHVQRLETDASGGTVTGVVTTLDDGSTTTFTGDIVVVACGAVNSAALLLRSRSDQHPDGLANSSGTVGRHYMRHNNIALMAVSLEPNPTRFTSASTRRTTSRASSGCATSSTGCSTTWACTSATCWNAASTCTRACPSARLPTRQAPSASAATPRPALSTSTARPTTWTTSMWWTRASSPASAP